MTMQTLEVISVNIWDILISLANLLILCWLFKRYLLKRVKKVLQKRQEELDMQYKDAANAQEQADINRAAWEQKLSGAEAEAKSILSTAAQQAKFRSDAIIDDANTKADSIIRTAKTEAELERKKAEDGIKQEIVAVSSALAEKMLEREINADDHSALISSFIDKIGEANEQ